MAYRSKYGNRKTVVNGITFDSKREAEVYQNLLAAQRAKQIVALTLQPRFELQPTFRKNGVVQRAITYVADFDVTWATGKREILDVKGFQTEVFRIKRKLFEYRYPQLTLSLV